MFNNNVAIIMPLYNGEKYLLEQLMSIYYQTHSNWYLIVVNDCSIDDSVSILSKRIENYGLYNKVLVLHNKKNLGVNKTVENGLKEAQKLNIYDFVCYCDADDIRSRNKLLEQVEYMILNPNCDMVYHDLTLVDENNEIISYSYRKKLHNFLNNPYDDSFVEFATGGQHITSTTMLFKSSLVFHLLPFSIHLYQDYWTVLVFSYIEKNFGYIDKKLGFYRKHSESLTYKNSCGNKSHSFMKLSKALDDLIDKYGTNRILFYKNYLIDRAKRYKEEKGILIQIILLIFYYPTIGFFFLKKSYYYVLYKLIN